MFWFCWFLGERSDAGGRFDEEKDASWRRDRCHGAQPEKRNHSCAFVDQILVLADCCDIIAAGCAASTTASCDYICLTDLKPLRFEPALITYVLQVSVSVFVDVLVAGDRNA